MKYPIGTQSFENLREGGFVYVDKTDLVYKLVDEGRVYFLCRPRRFGKSLLLSTLKAYFEGRKDLFEGLAINRFEKEWAVHPVFHLDFNNGEYEREGALREKISSYLSDWEKIYGSDPSKQSIGERFRYLLRTAYEKTGRKSVVLVDEYDKPILDVLDSPQEDENRNLLKAFYSTFKSADDSLRFVLLTGVTKFSQVSVFSGFNQPKDISMDENYDAICGITDEELFTVFAEPIAKMADKFGCTVEETKRELKRMYDGYHFSEALLDVYNPFSVLNAFYFQRFRDFWFASGTPTYLVKLLNHTEENLNELTGKFYDAEMFADYKADIEQPLPMIYQSGYLTIKEYNRITRRYRLDFPNNEVRKGFLAVLAGGYFKFERQNHTESWVADAFAMLYEGEVSGFLTSLTAFLASIPYDSHPGLKDMAATEKHFQYTFYLILRLMGTYCQTFVEKEYSQGRVDCIMEMNDYVYIFEFKLDGSSDEAIAQINSRGYATPYLADIREVRKIGIVFSSVTRTISDWRVESVRP